MTMTAGTEYLLDEHDRLAQLSRARILAGAQLYATEAGDRYQRISLDQLLEELDQEIADVPNYMVMARLKVGLLVAEIKRRYAEMLVADDAA